MTPRSARWLLSLYPAEWRDRYGAEFVALLEDSRLTWSVAFDVVAGAAREWSRTIFQAQRALWADLLYDIRLGARSLSRTPVLTTMAVLSLGVGVGANSAIFAVVNAVLMRALPVDRPDDLIAIGKTTAIDGHTTGAPRADLFSLPLYRDLRAELEADRRVVTGLAASGTAQRVDVRFDNESAVDAAHPNARFVSANFFSVLGVRAQRGRFFASTADDPAVAEPVVVISDAYWERAFDRANDVIGRRIRIEDAELTIVGVATPGFAGEVIERPTDLWLPLGIQPRVQPRLARISDLGTSWLLFLGRLAPGVTLDAAAAAFTTRIRAELVAHAALAGESARFAKLPVPVASGRQGFSAIRPKFRAALFTLQAAVGLLLLIVCTNLANLLAGRAVARRREMSVRLALGAGRGRLIRQLLAETSVLALLGAALGVLLAMWGSRALETAAIGAASAGPTAAGVDRSTLIFTLVVAVATLFGVGLAPALRASRGDLAATMRAHGRGLAAGRRDRARIPIGEWLVPAQVTLCLALLTGAALLARSLRKLESDEPGFDRAHLVVAQVDAARRGIVGTRFMALANELTDRLAALPGVRAATYSQNGFFAGSDAGAIVAVPGFVGRTSDDSSLAYDLVGPGYVHAIGGRLLRGRDIEATDRSGAPTVVLLNESAARFFFGDRDAVGRTMYFDAGVPATVVGIVADVHDHSITSAVERRAYAPYAQQIGDEEHPMLSFSVRTAADPRTIIPLVRSAIASADPTLPQVVVAPAESLGRDTIREQRLVAALASAFGAVALLLAGIGLYGVMSYAVTRRTAEIGLRAALGADRGDVLRLVFYDGLRLVGVGLAVGAPLTLWCAHALRAQLYGVPTLDPVSISFGVGSVLLCAIVGILLPALRAARVPPTLALSQAG